ncbi:MAG: MMPL family transporter [Clostridiales bacterium]|jgi:predicted RND superfamily exporter protein|nr:MMPL family transporter [Clostridiales bacterium]
MRNISNFIVGKSKFILAAFALLALCSVWMMVRVNINSDMTKYLPKDSATKIGSEIMNDEFSAASSFNLMIKGLGADEKIKIADELAAVPSVTGVAYEVDSAMYNKDDYTLYTVNVGFAAGTAEAKEVVNAVKESCAAYDITVSGDAAGNTALDILPRIIGIAFVILMIILLIMCQSWIEPFLFLLTIAAAIVINMGTNLILGSVSETTNSIAAILQLCLSMDYSIMLLNRYRLERTLTDNKNEAMSKALQNAFTSISSSSVTTIVGMLALCFMSFTIGRDMGLVLAKGVLLSLICIFTVLPALILIFDKTIEKTAKKSLHIKMDGIGSFSYAARRIIPIVFIAIFAVSFFLRGNVGISYTMSDYDKISRTFTLNNPIVVLYQKEDEGEIGALAEEWTALGGVDSVNAYATTLGKKLSCRDAAAALNIDESLTAQLYYYYFSEQGEPTDKKIALGEFLQFLQTDVATNEQFSALMTPDTMAQLGAMDASIPAEAMGQEYRADEFAALTQMDAATVTQLYNYYAVAHGDLPEGRIALDELVSFLADTVAVYEQWKPYFTADLLVQLDAAKAEMENGKSELVGDNYSRIIINTDLPQESTETSRLIEALEQDLESLAGEHYLVGNSAMAHEMSSTFPSEMNFITILTAFAIFVVVAIAFKSISIPLILVCIIQCAVFITMGLATIGGSNMYYLPLLIVQCLLLGATVDYGILLTSYYREARKRREKKEALIFALNHSIHTILTSASILIAVTGALGILLAGSDAAISEILLTIAEGGLCATVLVVFVLPGLLSAFDRFVVGKKAKG